MTGSRVVALGHYQPERVLTNAELATMVETNDEWIQSRVGIKERRIAAPDESVDEMAWRAADKAVANAGIDTSEIDYVVITAGSFDLLVEVVCEDDDHLLEIVGRIRGLPGVRNTETFVYMKLRKQHYDWGTR